MSHPLTAASPEPQVRVGEIDLEVSRQIGRMIEAQRSGGDPKPAQREITRLTDERRRLAYG